MWWIVGEESWIIGSKGSQMPSPGTETSEHLLCTSARTEDSLSVLWDGFLGVIGNVWGASWKHTTGVPIIKLRVALVEFWGTWVAPVHSETYSRGLTSTLGRSPPDSLSWVIFKWWPAYRWILHCTVGCIDGDSRKCYWKLVYWAKNKVLDLSAAWKSFFVSLISFSSYASW
jgi:hypothetical protein